jgi:recombination protein RecR
MYLSSVLENAVNEFSRLPGVGKKTAFRFVLHLLKQEEGKRKALMDSIRDLNEKIISCERCHMAADTPICAICLSNTRNQHQICIVESLKDVIAIENTNQYHGVYHILGGVISPIDGVGPDDLNIESIEKRIRESEKAELIMALNPTIEGDTTIYYLSQRFKSYPTTISTISRGVAFGAELDYTDELTLGRSILSRLPYDMSIKK